MSCTITKFPSQSWDHTYSIHSGAVRPNEASPDSMRRLDEIICDFMEEQGVPGAALSISLHGKPVYRQGFGIFGDGQPVTSSSQFRTASISKVLTAIGIMKLREEGKLDLTTKVFGQNGILNEYHFSDKEYRKVTVGHLLQHSAGWDRESAAGDQVFWYQQEKYKGKINPWNSQQMVEYVLKRKLSFKPGTKHAYSNFGYLVLGLVIERVTSQSYEEYTLLLLKEIGVGDITIGFTKKRPSHYMEVEYYNNREPVLMDSVFLDEGQVVPQYGSFTMENTGAYGGWVTSATDLVAILDSLVMEYGHCRHFLKADSVKLMLQRPRYEKGDSWYGLGLDVSDEGGSFGHTGNMEGTSSTLHHEKNGLTWALLMNAWAKDTDYDGLIKYALSTVWTLPMWQGINIDNEFLVFSADYIQCVRILLPHSEVIEHVTLMKANGYMLSHINALSLSDNVLFNLVWDKHKTSKCEWFVYMDIGVDRFENLVNLMHEKELCALLLESYVINGEVFHIFIVEKRNNIDQKLYCVEDKTHHRKIFCTYFEMGYFLKSQCILEYEDKILISAIYDKLKDSSKIKSQQIWLDISVDNFVYLLGRFYMQKLSLDYLQFYCTKSEPKVGGVWSSRKTNKPCFQRHDVSKYGFLYELRESLKQNRTVKFVSSYQYEGVVYFNAIWNRGTRGS